MTTEKQLAANQQNAQKSSGPRTATGMETASLNAITHGLSSQKKLLPWESQAEFDRLEEAMLKELKPHGEMERLFAQRVILNAWRLERAAAYEAKVISGNPEPKEILQAIITVSRYETRLERSMLRAMKELQQLQQRRLSMAPTSREGVNQEGTNQNQSLERPKSEQAPANAPSEEPRKNSPPAQTYPASKTPTRSDIKAGIPELKRSSPNQKPGANGFVLPTSGYHPALATSFSLAFKE